MALTKSFVPFFFFLKMSGSAIITINDDDCSFKAKDCEFNRFISPFLAVEVDL